MKEACSDLEKVGRYRIGIDIGGTFTDLVTMDDAHGTLRIVKLSSTPADPSEAFLRIIRKSLEDFTLSPSDAAYLVHGTTVATNTIIEGKGARTALIATKGFRDVFEIARQIRSELYSLFCDKPKPLIPRHLCFEANERMTARGQVLQPLSSESVGQIIDRLREERIESVVICLLHSYANAAHEQTIAEQIARELPGVSLSLSSALCPEMREYYRASTTAINGVVMPVVSRYIERLENRLAELGFQNGLHLMTSSGGIISSEVARREPVHLIESGPAAGVTAVAYYGELTGHKDLISFDMGGTTAKLGLVESGRLRIAPHFEVGSSAVADNRSSGYPVRTPVVDLVEIGAGGGSMAWIDEGGSLRVGPKSAGADPGPACYGKGQTLPCITDAHVFLGRINPKGFIGGEHELRRDLSEKAIQILADRLGLDAWATANGILEIANASMVSAVRLISVQRGFDPRKFVLVGYGGAGPLHANAIAEELDIEKTLIPMSPGLTSALGLLVGDIKHDFKRTHLRKFTEFNLSEAQSIWQEFKARGASVLATEGIPEKSMVFTRQLDIRYCGQSYELTIPCPEGSLDPDRLAQIRLSFFDQHRSVYGYASEDEPIEVVNLATTAIGRIRRPALRSLAIGNSTPSAAVKAEREVYFAACGVVRCFTYDRYKLRQADLVQGPAIIEEYDSTVVLNPGYQAEVDQYANLLITRKA
ncbi:hydantoinase/oxoprolinase family protein [soil metagenome]